jgi:hypothetical protein
MIRRPDREAKPAPVSRLQLFIDAGKVLLWPIVICVLVGLFYRPLMRIADGLASRMGEASRIAVAGVSVEFRDKVIEAAGPSLGEQVGKLSAVAVERLLVFKGRDPEPLTSSLDHFEQDEAVGIPSTEEVGALVELQERGLITSTSILKSAFARIALMPPHPENQGGEGTRWFEVPKKQRDLSRTALSAELTDEGKRAKVAILSTVSAMMKK